MRDPQPKFSLLRFLYVIAGSATAWLLGDVVYARVGLWGAGVVGAWVLATTYYAGFSMEIADRPKKEEQHDGQQWT